jgi:hypothetical protein
MGLKQQYNGPLASGTRIVVKKRGRMRQKKITWTVALVTAAIAATINIFVFARHGDADHAHDHDQHAHGDAPQHQEEVNDTNAPKMNADHVEN